VLLHDDFYLNRVRISAVRITTTLHPFNGLFSRKIHLMDNKHVNKQSKGCKFLPKIHQNTFMCSPDSLGPASKGNRREGREEDGNGATDPLKSR